MDFATSNTKIGQELIDGSDEAQWMYFLECARLMETPSL
jgi:hypothetical protein